MWIITFLWVLEEIMVVLAQAPSFILMISMISMILLPGVHTHGSQKSGAIHSNVLSSSSSYSFFSGPSSLSSASFSRQGVHNSANHRGRQPQPRLFATSTS